METSRLRLCRHDRIPLEAALLGLVVLLGTILRCVQLTRALNAPLDPDTIGYLTIAKRILSGNLDFTEPGQGGLFTREPLYPLVLAFALWIAGPASEHVVVRATSVVTSVLAIPVTYLLARRLFGSYVAPLASLLVALNGILVILSSRGLREDLVGLFLLALLIAAYGVDRAPNSRKRPFGHLCAAALLSLLLVVTRYEMVLVTIAVGVLLLLYPSTRGLKNRLSSSIAITCSSLLGVGMDMAIAYAAKVDPAGGSKALASWLYWFEFSSDHSTTYLQQGIWISMRDYLGHHSVAQLVFLEIRGFKFLLEQMNWVFVPYPLWNGTVFVDLYRFMNQYLYSSYPVLAALPIMAYVAVLGFVHTLQDGKVRLLVLPIVIPTCAYCFLYGVINVGDLIRYVAQFFPIIFITTSAFLVGLGKTVRYPSRLNCSGDRFKICLYYCLCMIMTTIIITMILLYV